MTTTTTSTGAEQEQTSRPGTTPEPGEAFGGEVRIGRGGAPPFLRWFNYATYLGAILYLLIFWPDTGYHPVVIVFAGLLAAWLAYIFLGRKPAEP